MEVLRTSETSVYVYETKRRYIPDGCHLHSCRCENLNSHNMIYCLTPLLFKNAFQIYGI
jgi:hypothetical protein